MSQVIEGTGSKSPAVDVDYAIFPKGRTKVRHIWQPIDPAEERAIRDELAGYSGKGAHLPSLHLPQPFLVDFHQSVISAADVFDLQPQQDTFLSLLGKRYPALSKGLVIGYTIWRLRKTP